MKKGLYPRQDRLGVFLLPLMLTVLSSLFRGRIANIYLPRMRFATIALAVLIGQASTQGTIFVTPQQQVAFGISIPDDLPSNDIYFSIAASSNLKWAGVGLGSSEMKGALFLIIYSSASGTNVTLSTRTVSDNVEPIYDSGFHVEALAGTGIANGTMTFLGRCTNCRSWSGGGAIDVASDAQNCIYGLAPDGPMNSDDPAASLNYHTIYGSFSVNLKQAVSSLERPPLLGTPGAVPSSGSALLSNKSTQNWTAIVHAVIMVGCFIGLLPLGIILLRVVHKVRWHAVNQSLALVGIVVGAGVGIYDSTRYNRSKSFNTAHQVVGLLVTILMVVQFVLGFIHHRMYKQTLQATKFAPVHVWLGRILIIASAVVAFLGFPLALTKNGDIILAVVVALVTAVLTCLILWKRYFRSSHNQQTIIGQTEATSRRSMGRRKFMSRPNDTSMLPLRSLSTRDGDSDLY
ncbi:CBD9-like protein [Coniochaeta sp. PMI_546]|nr:CBD9-like protein [Coniochaeta sp. PMI_546]